MIIKMIITSNKDHLSGGVYHLSDDHITIPGNLNVPCLYLLMMLITNPDRLEDPNDND